ncbi:MAG: peptidoglycan bridge formation glycyltransferase FemA/FemB family protein [Bacilli bacterium]|nr:peptidoglycan bridge formation glycyltransferase FemA/FemB family protein [Bacilli bacterium]
MRIVALTKDEFDNFAYKHKYSTYYQTSKYADVSKYEGLNTFYVGFVENEQLVGATLFLYKTVYLYYKYAYAPRGFLIDYTDKKLVHNVTMGLINLLKKQHYAFIKIDPPVICSERDKNGNIIYFSNAVNDILNTLNKNKYKHQGFNKYFENYKPRFVAFTSLQSDLKTIYAKISNDAKKIIETSTNAGVEIVQDKDGNIDELYKYIVLKNKKRRKKYYTGLFNNFGIDNKMDIFFININTDKYLNNMKAMYDQELAVNEKYANLVQDTSVPMSEKQKIINEKMESDRKLNYYKNELIYATNLSKEYPEFLTIGAAFTIKHNRGVELIIDSYLEEYLKFNPRYVLLWELIKKYKNENFLYFNLNAVVGDFNKEDLGKFKTLNNIKLQFNATVMEYIGEFDLVINERIYNKFKSKIEKK